MEDSENKFEKRKNDLLKKLSLLFEDKTNILLTGILLLAFLLRFYYFFLTKSQALWWDEAVYGSLARNFVSHTWAGTSGIIGETLIRPPLFPFLWSLFLRIGIEEVGVRFFLELIPSTISVFFVYLVGKELYGKRVGLISSFMFSFLWIHLFYTGRLLTHAPAMAFLFPSVYLFILATKGKFSPKYFSASLFLLSLSTLMRYPKGMIFGVYFLMLILEKKLLLKDKAFWISGLIGFTPMFVFFLVNFISFGNIFPALLGGNYLTPAELNGIPAPPNWELLNFLPLYLQSIWFSFFIIGGGVALFEIILGYDFIFKERKIKNNLLLIFILIAICSFFVFYLKAGEDRYFFPISLVLCIFAGRGIEMTSKFIEKYHKVLATLFIFGILFVGAYNQIQYADQLIKVKSESYFQQKQGFEWIKENSLEDEIIAGSGVYPYAMYYSQRKYIEITQNESVLLETKNSADYFVAHGFTPAPPIVNEFLQENKKDWLPLQVFFLDKQQTQPIFIIYKNIGKN